MTYYVEANQDSKNYWKVCQLERVDKSPEELCDLGTESLFIDSKEHDRMSLRINSSACSDFKQADNGEIAIYMQFKEELPIEMYTAFEREELFLSEM